MKNLKSEFLPPGGLYFRTTPSLISTTLGSCVSVIIFDPIKMTSGICHYLNSFPEQNSKHHENEYGIFAIENLIQKFLQNGSMRASLKAKIYGGANVTGDKYTGLQLCQNNISIAIDTLDKHGIPILDRNIRGKFGREITFNTSTFEVTLKTYDPSNIKGIDEIFEYITFKTGNESETRASVFHAEIRSHMRALGITDYIEYKDLVLSKQKISQELISKITNHTTEWFRYSTLQREILDFVKNRQDLQKLEVLSAGCSTGQEPYSIALFLKEYSNSLKYKITGIDVDSKSIEIAKKGEYKIIEQKFIPNIYQSKLKVNANHFTISNIIKDNCFFETRDLRKILSLEKKFDLVICLNVLMYFSNKDIQRITDNFAMKLKKDGLLFVNIKQKIDHNSFEKVSDGVFKRV
ncbi:CheR family methyltransferase [Halobacteriovorax sp. HLS]|uniref:CheR family methyltransferase n=1 Tax=Halobacteriovorax sp. HLS TaxID=2234000 RepID=UPI000FDB79D2|nr:CheR family methyltransferase [Halobacteriovorax sp. HLS]